MKRLLISYVLILLALSALAFGTLAPASAKGSNKWRRYTGAWFGINYPPGFKQRPHMKSLTAEPGYDSAFFISPDKKVEFYVFSPQWDGESSDIFVNPKKEKLISSKTQTKATKRVIWVSIHAKDGSYQRSYIDIRESEAAPGGFSRRIFGIKYTNQKTYKKYQKDYLKFQKSLEQYAD